MPSAIKKYAFINAKLRTRLSKILSPDFFDSMIRAHSLVDVMQLLKNTSFASLESIYSQTGDLKMAELELFKDEIFLYKDVERHVDGEVRDFCHSLSAFYEIENLKRILRLWFDRVFRGRDIEDIMGYLFREPIHHDLHIDRILSAGDFQAVVDALEGTPYCQIFSEALPEIQAKNSLFAFEIALDKHYFANLLASMKNLDTRDHAITRRMIGIEIDILNINWIIRFKTLYNLPLAEALSYTLPFGYEIDRAAIERAYDQERVTEVFEALARRYKGFTAILKDQSGDAASRLILIERILEYILMQEVGKALVGYPFSIGIVLAYFILKKIEIKKIMTILNAKQYGIKPEEIAGKL